MITREDIEKAVPKDYAEAMNDHVIATFINNTSLWGKLIDLGFVADYKEAEEYQRKLWTNGLRDAIIDKTLENYKEG